MNQSVKVVAALVAIGVLFATGLILRGARRAPSVKVTIRIAVTPPEQTDFVFGQASSARFKYLAGKQAGVKPALAQKLAIKLLTNPPRLEAEVHLSTRQEAQEYAKGFVETLQMVCGTQAQVALAGQSIR